MTFRIRTALISSAVALVVACGGGPGRDEMQVALATMLDSAKAPAHLAGISWETLRGIYADRGGHPLWVSASEPLPRARALVEGMSEAESEGLRAADYDLDGLREALHRTYREGKTTAAELAELDVRLTGLYLSYGSDLLAGRIDPSAVDPGWYIQTRRASADSTLRAVARTDDFDGMVQQLAPRQEEYAALVAALARHRAMAAEGGWATVPASVRPGSRGAGVAALRARLAATGDLDSAAIDDPPIYDPATAAAVQRFRVRHGLPLEGGLDRAALAALNVPVEQRVQQIELNLERLRWLPNEFGDRYVLVNIPDFHLLAFDGGREVLKMRVIVGEDYENETPIFADTMSYVEFRPYWNVPRGIMFEEIVPKARENENYLRANRYQVVPVSGDTMPVDPREIDWDDIDSTDFPYRVRQAPGAGNALGLVKFMFPNRFNIYLHDTPAEHLFHEHERALSHGCIRVQYPEQFAEYVLAGSSRWTPDRIDEAMQGDVTVNAQIERKLPVYIVYLTTFVRDGRLHFRDDVYGTDRRGIARLGESASTESVAALRETLDELMEG